MAERYQRAFAGKPFSMPAALYNDLLDLTKWWKLQTSHTGPGSLTTSHERTIVRVQNTDEGDMDERFSVIGIEGVLYGPADNEREFLNNFTLTGITPTAADHTGKFAILRQPLRSGALGRAMLVGVTPCKVNIISADDEWADVKDGDATQLESGSTGAARILWKPPSVTGTQQCLVQLGATAPSEPIIVRVEKTGGADGTASTAATWTYSIYPKSTSITTAIATGVAVVRPRPNGMMTFQASNTGYGLAFQVDGDWKLWDAGEIPTTDTCPE